MKYATTQFTLLLWVFSAFAQTSSAPPTDDLTVLAEQVTIGQTMDEIEKLLGKPNTRPGGGQGAWSCGSRQLKSEICWTLSAHDTLVVTFRNDRGNSPLNWPARHIAHMDLSAQGWTRPSRRPPADAPPTIDRGDTVWSHKFSDGTVLSTWRATSPEETSSGITAQFDVGEDGLVTNIRVQTGLAASEELAKYAISQWRFRPAIKDGHIAAWKDMQVVLVFRSESAECAFARQQYEQAMSRYNEMLAKRLEYIDAVRAMQRKWTAGLTMDQQQAYIDEASRLGDQLDQLRPQLDLMKTRVGSADPCARVYHDTIDKKTADLTTRESQLIQSCQYLGLYPPLTQ